MKVENENRPNLIPVLCFWGKNFLSSSELSPIGQLFATISDGRYQVMATILQNLNYRISYGGHEIAPLAPMCFDHIQEAVGFGVERLRLFNRRL